MRKKQLLHILSILIIIAGVAVTVLGVMRYRDETSIQQPVVEEYSWDNDGKQQVEDIVIESNEVTSDDHVTGEMQNATESEEQESSDVMNEELPGETVNSENVAESEGVVNE